MNTPAPREKLSRQCSDDDKSTATTFAHAVGRVLRRLLNGSVGGMTASYDFTATTDANVKTRHYRICCANCGEFWAPSTEFDQFLNKEVLYLLDARPGESVFGLYYDPGCPACTRNGTADVRVSVLRRKPGLRRLLTRIRGFLRGWV